jgi:hypothetical protein
MKVLHCGIMTSLLFYDQHHLSSIMWCGSCFLIHAWCFWTMIIFPNLNHTLLPNNLGRFCHIILVTVAIRSLAPYLICNCVHDRMQPLLLLVTLNSVLLSYFNQLHVHMLSVFDIAWPQFHHSIWCIRQLQQPFIPFPIPRLSMNCFLYAIRRIFACITFQFTSYCSYVFCVRRLVVTVHKWYDQMSVWTQTNSCQEFIV